MFVLSACGEMSSKIILEAFVNEAASWTNNDYGGLNIAADQVVYVHGSVDPWHTLGMTTAEESDAPAIFIRGTTHAAIMDPSTKEDKQSTTWAGVVKARSPKLLGVLDGAPVTPRVSRGSNRGRPKSRGVGASAAINGTSLFFLQNY